MTDIDNAGAVTPFPATIVCARCGGAIEPGLERCPTCGARQPRLVAARPSGSGLAGALVGLGGLLLPLAWLWPGVFRHLGLPGLSNWLEAGPHRFVMLVPIWITIMVAYGFKRARLGVETPKAWAPFAAATGGELKTGPARLEAGGWRGGLEVRERVQRWLLTLDTLREGSEENTRLRCVVVPRRDFQFALMPQNRMVRALASPRVGGFLIALTRNAAAQAPSEAAQRQLHDVESLMLGEVVELGEPEFDHAFVVKSDDPAVARALFNAQRGPLLKLRRPGSWWQLTLVGSVATGTAQLEYRESGVVRDAARLDAIRDAMVRVLETLAGAGLIGQDGPASNP